MRTENIKIRILVPFTLAIAFIIAMFIFVTYRYMYSKLDEDWSVAIQKFQESFKTELDLDAETMNTAMDGITRDESLREALKNRDRAALLKEAQPMFNHYLAEHNITHLYFHGPDGINILRVHKPEKYGDRIDRFTLLEAEKIAQGKGERYYAKGIELGPLGIFTNRVVLPWFDGKALIGYVEMGKELDRVLEEVRKNFSIGLYIFIHKEFLDRGKWEEGMKMLGRKLDWDRYPYSVNVSGPIEQVSEEAIQTLAGKHLPHSVEKIEVKEKNRYYHFGKIPLVDAGGREVGHMVVLSEYTAEIGAVRSTVMLVSIVFLGIGAALFVFFYIITGRTERDLGESRSRLVAARDYVDNVIRSTMDALVVVNTDATIRTVNQAALDLLGYKEDELLGRPVGTIFEEEEFLFKGTGIADLIRAGSITNIEKTYLSKDGRKIPVLFSGSVMRNGEGKIQGVVCVARDITERKKAEDKVKDAYHELTLAHEAGLNIMEDLDRERKTLAVAIKEKETLLEQLERVNKELQDFAYIVSHDLKAPLRAIGTITGWLAEDYKDKLDDAGREQLDLLLNRTQRMHGMIEGILHYSRAGRVMGEPVQVETKKVVDDVVSALSPPANIRITIHDSLPPVFIDPLKISQVFQNLISNAVKYMDKTEGLIEVGCRDAGEFWEFYVKDNGPGIEERHFERIFQIFQTLKPRDEFESTGIGLTIVKKIIEQNGGRIWVESDVGKGSTFKFTLSKG